jgi:uncharacterized membrane protein
MTIARWIVVTAVAAIVVLIGGVAVLGVMVVGDEERAAYHPGQMMMMERSGEMGDMLKQHQQMLEHMRSDAHQDMRKLMDKDPMTHMMQSGDMLRLHEQHRADVERLLDRDAK